MLENPLIRVPLEEDEVIAAQRNLAYFTERVLGYENNDHHYEWYQVLEDLLDGGKKKFALLAPRNHSKSTSVSVNFPLWVIGNNPNVRILIISSTASQAESFLRSISFTVENDERYKEVYGTLMPEYSEKWTQREIIINRTTKEKDPTIATVGAGGAILSKRADIIIADDILSKENTRTIEQRQKLLEWWRDVVMPVLDPEHGKLLWVGTVWNSMDLAHQIMKDPTYDFKKKYQAIIRHADRQDLWTEYKSILYSDEINGKQLANNYYASHKREMDRGAIVLWPQRWSYKTLMDEMFSVGTRSFALSYQNDVRDDENATFKESWIDACTDKNAKLLNQYDPAQDIYNIIVRSTGVDLAVSEKREANESVVLTVGLRSDNKFQLLNAVKGRFSPAKLRSEIIDQGHRFDPGVIYVESNAFQASLVKDSQEMSELPIQGYQTSGEKFDDVIGINGLAVTFENGQWVLPANDSDPHTIMIYESLKEAMMQYTPSSHTSDILMALWFAWTGIRKLRSGTGTGIVKSAGRRRSVNV